MNSKRAALALSLLCGFSLFVGCGAGAAAPAAPAAAASGKTAPTASAASPEAAADADGGQQIDFTDALGRALSIPPSQRAAALIGSFADIWLLAGGTVCAAPQDAWDTLALPLAADTVSLGSLLAPGTEALIASRPDLVLASANLDADLALKDTLAQAGIPVAYFDVSDFSAYLAMLSVCTRLTGHPERYAVYGAAVQQQVDAAVARADESHPKVLFLRSASGRAEAKGSRGNVGTEMLKDLGCINLADSDTGLLENLSMEAILMADPDFIFLTPLGGDGDSTLQALTADPAWQSLRAVRQGRVYTLDKRLYNAKPNARWGEAYAHLADILYGGSGAS